jgi:hypothetical protein
LLHRFQAHQGLTQQCSRPPFLCRQPDSSRWQNAPPHHADNPSNDILISGFHSSYPAQIPATFAISQLPDEILSWALPVLQITASLLIAKKKAATKTSTASGTTSGVDGLDSASKQDTFLTPSSLVIAPPSGLKMEHLMDSITSPWLQALCGKLQATGYGALAPSSTKSPSP